MTINAIGTANDARIPGQDLWRSRETDFDVDIETESVIGDDFLTLEACVRLGTPGIARRRPETWRAIVDPSSRPM